MQGVPMRVSGLDHLRGLGVVCVIVFSLWYWMYYPEPSFSPLVHVVPGEFHIGDLVFPLFVFCSGVSLHLYSQKVKKRGGTAADAERKYLKLLLVALAICGLRLFLSFPDEVMVIAMCDIIAVNLFWSSGKSTVLRSALLIAALLLAVQAFLPSIWAYATGTYLGGWLAIPYYLIILLFGLFVAQQAFPDGEYAPKATLRALLKWSAAFALASILCLLLWPLDRSALTLTFIAFSTAASAIMLLVFVRICDKWGRRSSFLSVLGANSLWGWALLYALSTMFWFMGKKGNYYTWAYLPFCALVLFALYFALLALGKGKGKKDKK